MTRMLPICINFLTKIFKVNSIYLHENPMKNLLIVERMKLSK